MTYIRDFHTESCRERGTETDYNKRDSIAAKWQFIAEPESYCSNFSTDLKVSKDGKIGFKTKKQRDDWKYSLNAPGLYDIMPSAMWLYRLACTFAFQVNLRGPEGYKVVWSATFKHAATGIQIHFYEWKGGFTFGATGKTTNKVFRKDMLELLNYLASEHCMHPYDGCVAGFVA